MPALLEVFLRFLRLGVTAFGGPVAHLGYFRREFVERARWLDDAAFAEIVALCTVLPGPTSSQVGMLLGAKRAGPLGSIAAWLAFTTPSAVFLSIAGVSLRRLSQAGEDVGAPAGPLPGVATHSGYAPAALHGALASLAFIAAAVVFYAALMLARSIVVTPFARIAVWPLLLFALVVMSYAPQLAWVVLLAGGIAGAAFASRKTIVRDTQFNVPRSAGLAAGALLAIVLASLPLVTGGYGTLFATTFRAGALVFGGGHVVLAFLASLAGSHAVPRATFEEGYGIVQAVPGPLFTFASLLGAADTAAPNPWAASAIATIAIFLPSFLLLPAALAFWNALRSAPRSSAVLEGLNVAVVGLLAATFVNPVCTTLGHRILSSEILCAVAAYVLLAVARLPAWAVVIMVAGGAAAYAALAAALHFPAFARLL